MVRGLSADSLAEVKPLAERRVVYPDVFFLPRGFYGVEAVCFAQAKFKFECVVRHRIVAQRKTRCD